MRWGKFRWWSRRKKPRETWRRRSPIASNGYQREGGDLDVLPQRTRLWYHMKNNMGRYPNRATVCVYICTRVTIRFTYDIGDLNTLHS
jgi:hypothetical protein